MPFKKGQKVKVASDNDNDAYDSFRDKVLIITDIDKEFDKEGGWLYSFKDAKTEEEIGNSLYEWELEKA